jgi:hypothetical protein
LNEPSGAGDLQPLQGFMTSPAGSAIVNAIGPIRQIVRDEDRIRRRYLVIVPGAAGNLGVLVQVQVEAGLPARALAREAAIAQAEIARLLRATVSDLERRAKRGKRR